MDDVNTVLDELKSITGTTKISDLSSALGVSPSTIRTWRTRGKIPEKIIDSVKVKHGITVSKNETVNHIHLPFYEISASAGTGALVEVEEQANLISFQPEYLRKEIGVNPNDVFLMMVEGDSMEPTLKSEAMIMVNRHYNSLSDGIYVLRHDHSLLVKRLQILPTGIIKVKSDNTMYDPWEINKEHLNGTDIELIGRVVWTGQRM